MDSLVYARLTTDSTITTLVSGRVYPVWPEYDAILPLIVYARTSTEDNVVLGGSIGILKYEYTFDIWAINADTAGVLADAVYTRLTTWRTSPIQGCFLQSDQHEATDIGFNIQQTYAIFAPF